MKKDIRNYDKNNKLHGLQITYHCNGNISAIRNFHNNNWNGYQGWFHYDNSINFKEYWNMDDIIYEEEHWGSNQIKIRI